MTYAALYLPVFGHGTLVKVEFDVMLDQAHMDAPIHIAEYEIKETFPDLTEEECNMVYQTIDHDPTLKAELLAQAENNYDGGEP